MLNIRNSEELFQQDENQPATRAAAESVKPDGVPPELPVSDFADQPAEGEAVEVEESAPGSEVEEAADQTRPGSQVLCLAPVSFSEQLRNLRAEAGMTVADVAQKVRSSQAFILNLESGDFCKIRQHDHYCKSFIERICMVYQSDPEELLEKFDQESRAAGRSSEQDDNSFQTGGPGACVFGEDDLSQEKEESAALHLPAILISLLVGLLVVLLISAWFIQKIRARKNVEILHVIEAELPLLITPKKRPLEVLPIPNN